MWLIDVVHCPAPISRLDYELRMHPFAEASNEANARYGVPMTVEPKLIHGFIYNKLIDGDVTAEAMPAAMQALDAAVRKTYGDLASRWQTSWLPEIQSHLAELNAFDVRGASFPALVAQLAEVKRRSLRLWVTHQELLTPVLVALSDLDQAYRDLFPEAKPLEVYDLLTGFPNKTTEANARLWELGRNAARTPALREIITATPPADLQAALAKSDEGRALWSEIESYLTAYGERNDDLFSDSPTWIDDPTPVLRGLREAVLQPDRDLTAELGQQAARREARLVEVRAQIASHPRAIVDELEALLAAAQTATVLSEDHHFWIDCKITHHIRRVAIEVGRRLAEHGVIDTPDDVFQLELAELAQLREPAAGDASHLRALIAERRAEAARYVGVTPPTLLGVPRAFLPMDCAVMRASFKFSGNLFGPPGGQGDLTGMPGASGKVIGPARIVRTLDDTTKLRPGDILVAPFTLPSWTPFFASVAGVVTNIGGTLCHAAVVAREYRIPAVVGTQRATETLRDGQLIEVDGDTGTVRLVAE